MFIWKFKLFITWLSDRLMLTLLVENKNIFVNLFIIPLVPVSLHIYQQTHHKIYKTAVKFTAAKKLQ